MGNWTEGTDIDFPIVQGKDNDFYLDHNYKNQYHAFGSVYMDYRNSSDFSDLNTVLYGHNVRSGHVFHDLVKYNDENVVNDQPYIIVDTQAVTALIAIRQWKEQNNLPER